MANVDPSKATKPKYVSENCFTESVRKTAIYNEDGQVNKYK